MRMKHKPWAQPELDACGFYVKNPREQKGKWNALFPRRQPLHIELGCGKGVSTAVISAKHPEINYIAVDLKSEVLAVAKRNIDAAFEEAGRPADNIFLCIHDIERILLMLDEKDTVDRIYINFCNPWPRGKHRKRRLTHTRQLTLYKTFLKPGGQLYFKTDDDGLFNSTLLYLKESGFKLSFLTRNLHAGGQDVDPDALIMTEHEKKFSEMGVPIKFLIARYEGDEEKTAAQL